MPKEYLMIIIQDFPQNAFGDMLKAKHLIEEAQRNNDKVLGVIEKVTIEVYPLDDICDVVLKLREKRRKCFSRR